MGVLWAVLRLWGSVVCVFGSDIVWVVLCELMGYYGRYVCRRQYVALHVCSVTGWGVTSAGGCGPVCGRVCYGSSDGRELFCRSVGTVL